MAYVVDMRSDTVTKPTKAMMEAMMDSELGDDVFGEDLTVNVLEKNITNLLGKQSALFVPSGTMSNLIALMVHCSKRGSECIVGDNCHIFKSEQGGAAHLGGILLHPLPNKPDGTFDLNELENNIKSTRANEPITSLVAIENTHNRCGGKVLPLDWLEELSAVCKRHSLPLHMDGARLFNACQYSGESPERVVRHCDSVSVCFSKGLSAPVGSALVGSYHFIQQARRMRKMLGGGMRQGGVLAAAALVALDEIVPKLGLDHQRAYTLGESIQNMSLKTLAVDLENQHTNIILVRILQSSSAMANEIVERLAQISSKEIQDGCKTSNGEGVIVKATSFDDKTIRFTLHHEITDEDLNSAIMKVKHVFKEIESNLYNLPIV